MKLRDITRSLLLITLLILGVNKAFCQDVKLIKVLNTLIKPITALNPGDSFEDIAFLRDELKDEAIIGIGESTHGSRLYDIYRQRLVRFLVQNMGYKAIIDEGDILAAEKLDAYINNRTDSLEYMGGLGPVVTSKKELNWLRAYNKNKSGDERVHLYGAEVRGFHGIVQKVKGLYPPGEMDPDLEKTTSDIGVGYKNLTKKDFESLRNVAEKLKGQRNSALRSYYLSLFNQQIDFAYRQRFGRGDFGARDKYMFENIKHIISKTTGNKVIILAHNGHLQKTKFMTLTSLGYLLDKFYGSRYFVIATDFGKGSVNIYDFKSKRFKSAFFGEVNDANAIEYYFKKCMYPDFILPVGEALKNPVTAPLVDKKIKMLRNMTASGDLISAAIRLDDNYDLVVFFRNSHVATDD